MAFWHTLRLSALAGLALAAACSAPPSGVSQGAVSAPTEANSEAPEDSAEQRDS